MRHARGLIPCRKGRGFLFLASIALAALATLPAQAANVNVRLKISAAEPATTNAVIADCSVSVASGADGVTILNVAKSKGCISSFQTRTYPGLGRYVSCVNDICEVPAVYDPDVHGLATYWRYTKNASYSDVGIDGFYAAAGDVLGLSFTNFITDCNVGCIIVAA